MSRRRLSLKEIHEYEVELLKEFVSVCEENNLRYYLAGGTLLGAIRHKGFIPWDDDIDILMPRPDYNKFLSLNHKEIFSKNILVASDMLGNLNHPFCKIFDSNLTIEKEYADDETERHLWIDILPLDGLPDDEEEIKSMFKKSLLARRILKLQKAKLGRGTSKAKIALKYVAKPVLRLIGVKRVVKYITDLGLKYDFDESRLIGGVVMGYGPQETMVKEDYLEVEKVEFEGLKLNAPKCWDFYLTSLYKNYMELPPKEQQQAHYMSVWIEE